MGRWFRLICAAVSVRKVFGNVGIILKRLPTVVSSRLRNYGTVFK